MKAATRRKLFYTGIGIVLAAVVAVVIVPPMLDFDRLKPQIESAILNQTGIDIDISGRVRLSLLGRATITAYDIKMREYGNGVIDSVSFHVPLGYIFNIYAAPLSDTIILRGAKLHLTTLAAPSNISSRVEFRDSAVTFLGKTYKNIDGVFQNGLFDGTVRTNDHKYTLSTDGDTFQITNPNVNLNLTGQLATNDLGEIAASGEISIDSDNVNKWFEFDVPKISGRVKFRSEFLWRGDRFRFYNISGTLNSSDFAGDIEFGGEAPKIINMVVNNLDYDFASVVNNTAFIKNSEINFTANGRIKSPMPFAIPVQKFAQTAFSRFHISLTGDADLINVKSLRAENESASISAHGVIANGIAKGLDWVVFDARENAAIRCEMFGTVNDWSCSQWDYKDANFSATGKSTINGDTFILIMESDNLVLEGFTKQVPLLKSLFGKQNGNITATLGSGTRAALSVRGKDVEFSYSGHPNTNLASVPGANEFIKLLPERMQKSSGTMHNAEIKNGKLLSFSFEHFGKNHAWAISMDDPYNFRIYADARYLISAFYPSVDAKFLHPELDVLVTGNFKSKYITDLKINVGDNWIFGKFDGKKFDLGANMLDLDSLINPEFINNYESMKFVTAEPLTVPFALNLDLTLSADQIKFMDEVYDNFNYSLKPDNQKMSITDAAKGSILLTIDKKLSRYNIAVASNKFEILGLVLPRAAALNVADTMLTGRAELSTYGITANDFWVHMSGDLDLTFDGGILVGFDIDNFYAGSNSITKMNAEYAISDALSGGLSQLKSLQIAGHYEDGEFKTTSPLKASLRHSEIMGHIQTIRGRISANLNVLLRATSPEPRPISLLMNPNGEREFSLSEIMQTFDPDFMREFVKIHNRF